MQTLAINCDLGEELKNVDDAEIMPLIEMANVACGGHAGTRQSMTQMVRSARKNGVKIGAHPSYEDRKNFGRRHQNLSGKKLFSVIKKQITTLQEVCLENDAKLSYVKPHGALYHDMMADEGVLQTIISAIRSVNPDLGLIVQYRPSEDFQKFSGVVRFFYEVFADRGYDGWRMIPRGEGGAVFDNPQKIIAQYQKFQDLAKTQKIDTICFHSDNPASVTALQKIHDDAH